MVVDQEGWRTPETASICILQILITRRLMLPGIKALVEKCRIQSQFCSVTLQIAGSERSCLLEQQVMVLPKMALVISTLGRLSCFRGLGGDYWKISPHEAHLVSINCLHLFEDPCVVPRPTCRTAEIPILDDRHRSTYCANKGIIIQPILADRMCLRSRPEKITSD